MLPPPTDFFALLGLNLVLCSICLRLSGAFLGGSLLRARVLALACFGLLWLPLGSVPMPLVAYVRGVSSDLSITLVLLAALALWRRLSGRAKYHEQIFAEREALLLYLALALTALCLYPLALGWGDWDLYRLGWGSVWLWAGLLVITAGFLASGLRLLPVAVALALLCWSLGFLESNNLWDYLIDPWLALLALGRSAAALRRADWRRMFVGRPLPRPSSHA